MTDDEISEAARRVFGHEQLWPGQYEGRTWTQRPKPSLSTRRW